MKRVLHIFHLCGRAGTEAAIRFVIQGLTEFGVEGEAFFERDRGGSDLFYSLCPTHFSHETTLEALLASGRFDAVHAITSALTLDLPLAVERSRFSGPVIVSCQNDYIIGWSRCNANGVIACTDWWARKIRPYTDLPVTVVPNPVDLERFTNQARGQSRRPRPIIGWVGRSADPAKNVARLREIIGQLPPDTYDLHIADGDTRPDPRELFGALTPRITWYGRRHYTEMPAFYQEIADSGGVLLSTADSEAFPVSIVEAMACGCPVVVPDAWGSDEIVDFGRAGLIYRRAEGPGAALRCLEELRRPDRWQQIADTARALAVKTYNLSDVSRQYLEAFEAAARLPRYESLGKRAAWAARSAGFYLRRPPQAMWLRRPRQAAESLERALRFRSEGSLQRVRPELLRALRAFPLVYLKPWRAKFLLSSLLSSRSHE